MPLAKRYDVAQTFVLYGPNGALGVGVGVWTSGRKSQKFHPGASDDALELLCVKRITVDNGVSRDSKEAVEGISQIASDLRHPCAVELTRYAGDVYASTLEVDDKEHEIANQATAG